MGFVRQKTYTLTWPEGAELEGLQVRAAATQLRVYMLISAILDGDPPDSHTDDDGTVYEFKADPESTWRYTIKAFSRSLLGWNLTDKQGAEVAATEAEMWNQDREFVLIVIRAWLDALASVSRPLPTPSPAGTQLAVASIPMETLSENLAS